MNMEKPGTVSYARSAVFDGRKTWIINNVQATRYTLCEVR